MSVRWVCLDGTLAHHTTESDSDMSSTACDSYSTVPKNEYRPGPVYLIAWTRSVTVVAVPRHRNKRQLAMMIAVLAIGMVKSCFSDKGGLRKG